MATNQPQNLLEWQLHCVLQRANLLQYYDSFIRQGECNVLQLSESDDEKFKDVMEKVGMDKKSIHVRQFKKSLLEWVKNPGKDTHVPSNIRKTDNFTTSPAPIGLEPGTVPLSLSEKSYTVKHVPNLKQKIQTKDKEGATSITLGKKKDHQTRGTKQKHPQSDHEVKDEEHHGLTGYYDKLLDNTVLDKMILDNLISRCIIMIEDREEIIKPTTQRERNKVLLDILTERPYPKFHLFKDVLQESEPSNSCVQDLVKRMMSTESRDEHISWQGHEIGTISESENRHCLQQPTADIGIFENERRILLIGKTGVGKSTTGNTILGKDAFVADTSGESVTKKTEYARSLRYGRNLLVVDTPGLFDTRTPNNETMIEIAQCYSQTAPGLHAIIIVLAVGRITQQEIETFNFFLTRFGKEVIDYMTVIFTGKYQLDHQNKTIQQFVANLDPKSELTWLLNRIQHRYTVFGYREKRTEREEEVKELLQIIDNLVEQNEGKYYTNEMYKRTEKILTERWEEEKRKEKEKLEKEIETAKKSVQKKYEETEMELKKKMEKQKTEHEHKMKLLNMKYELKQQINQLEIVKIERNMHKDAERKLQEREHKYREAHRSDSGFFMQALEGAGYVIGTAVVKVVDAFNGAFNYFGSFF